MTDITGNMTKESLKELSNFDIKERGYYIARAITKEKMFADDESKIFFNQIFDVIMELGDRFDD